MFALEGMNFYPEKVTRGDFALSGESECIRKRRREKRREEERREERRRREKEGA